MWQRTWLEEILVASNAIRVRCVLTKPKEWQALPDEGEVDAIGRNTSRWHGSGEGDDALHGGSLFKKDGLCESCVGASSLRMDCFLQLELLITAKCEVWTAHGAMC